MSDTFPLPGVNFSELQVGSIRARRKTEFVFDPKGFFVIFLDKIKQEIVLEHYLNVSKEDSSFQVATGKLNKVIRGKEALAIKDTIIEQELVSRMDHMGYLGCELAKAETALRLNLNYEQDDPLGPSEND